MRKNRCSLIVMMIFKLGVTRAWSTVKFPSSTISSTSDTFMRKNEVKSSPPMLQRYFHQSTALKLNRFLFDPSEIDSPITDNNNDSNNDNNHNNNDHSLSATSAPTVTLSKQDYRTIHAAKVLGLHNNDTLRAGIVQDNVIELKTTYNNKYNRTISSSIVSPTSNSELYGGLVTDEASITWIPEGKIKKAQPTKNGDPPGSLQITLHSLTSPTDEKTTSIDSNADKSPQISLILALPRPLALARLLPMISMMGVHHLILTSAQKVPKDYFGSHLFRKPNEIRKLLIEGLCQAGDVKIPTVTVVNRLKPFVEDDLDNLFPREDWARVIAHPLRKQQGNNKSNDIRMDDIKFPSSSNKKDDTSPSRILLAVGPEGGWAEPYELDMFQEHDFQQITLGSRILRSDVAVVSLLSLAHDLCARR